MDTEVHAFHCTAFIILGHRRPLNIYTKFIIAHYFQVWVKGRVHSLRAKVPPILSLQCSGIDLKPFFPACDEIYIFREGEHL